MAWPRPVPTTGDRTSSAERAAAPAGWALPPQDAAALARVIGARRDIRRFRPDPVDSDLLWSLLDAAHQAPSVGHSQPWRFVVVRDPVTRQRAAVLADRARLAQAAALDERSGRHLLDLDLEGIREAPVGIVVCCDRRAPAGGVLGRATLPEADVWSCACAIENLWLAARAAGLGVGWVTLFGPGELVELVGAPDGVVSLGWLCVGWPDERPPAPGLERRGWSERRPLGEVVLTERWPAAGGPERPRSRLRPPSPAAVVAARDQADRLLAPPGALGVLDRAVDRVLALGRPVVGAGGPGGGRFAGSLVLVAADHPVADLDVSPYPTSVTRHVMEAALAGSSLGAVAAAHAGLALIVVDAGVNEAGVNEAGVNEAGVNEAGVSRAGVSRAGVSRAGVSRAGVSRAGVSRAGGEEAGAALAGHGGDLVAAVGSTARRHRAVDARGDLVTGDALSRADVARLVAAGHVVGLEAGAAGLVALGEVGVGNTTVAAAVAAVVLELDADTVVGLGSGADSAMVARKVAVVDAATRRWAERRPLGPASDPWEVMAAVGGPELAVLAGVCLGAAEAGAVVVLDGLATSVAALTAVMAEPAVAAHLVAGQRSRERAHGPVLDALGLEPLLDLRLRAGEGAGACLAAGLLAGAVEIRRRTATTA
jgi:nicotinate-nucleotide--dimethylbenzimidazole phosphoribosyltransferase